MGVTLTAEEAGKWVADVDLNGNGTLDIDVCVCVCICVCACAGTNILANVHTQEFEHTARRILNMACDIHCIVCQFLAKQGVRENAL